MAFAVALPRDRPPCPPGCKGEDHSRCTSHNNAGQCCGTWPIKGARVCRSHGGAAPQVRAAAERRLLEAEVRRSIAFDVGEVLHPGELVSRLLAGAGRAISYREAVGQMVNALPKFTANDTNGAEYKRVLVQMYEDAEKHEHQVLLSLARLGIDERQVRANEKLGRLMAGGMAWYLQRRGLAGDPEALADLDMMLAALAEGRLPGTTGLAPEQITP